MRRVDGVYNSSGIYSTITSYAGVQESSPVRHKTIFGASRYTKEVWKAKPSGTWKEPQKDSVASLLR